MCIRDSQYTVAVPQGISFDPNFVNIVTPNVGIDSLTINGAPIPATEFTPYAANGFSFAVLPVTSGTFRLEGDHPFGAIVYGFTEFTSYAYTAGTQLSNVGLVDAIDVTPSTATLLPNNTHDVSATVTDDLGNTLENILVEFTVVGVLSLIHI